MGSHFGELIALLTAVCWTVSAIAFESAGRKVGSLSVNLIRLIVGFCFLSLFTWAIRGFLLPTDADWHQWIWLFVSGLIGFAVGDLFLFRAFVVIGSRLSMLIMSLVPPITAVIGWVLLGEILTALNLTGMCLTVLGVGITVMARQPAGNRSEFSLRGVMYAVLGAIGQAVGLVFSKFGMQDYNAFAATQIRGMAGILSFLVIVTLFRRWNRVGRTLSNPQAMKWTFLGAVFGPFLGVSFSLLAIQNAPTGVASTIMAIVPVMIIPPAVLIFKERVTVREMAGAFLAVIGVGILFL
ncbi:MAG TPA: DMT family transporter [bacterium]|nr:DMT family transporter [bacterium]